MQDLSKLRVGNFENTKYRWYGFVRLDGMFDFDPIASVHCKFWEDKIKVSVGVEQPYSDIQWFENGAWVVNPNTGIITDPTLGRNIQDMPDFTGNIHCKCDYGHFQVAGIVRKLTFQPAGFPGRLYMDVEGEKTKEGLIVAKKMTSAECHKKYG